MRYVTAKYTVYCALYASLLLFGGCLFLAERNQSTLSATSDHKALRDSNFLRSDVTVVTAYYTIPSKADKTIYLKWMSYFLSNIPCFLYVFTTRKMFLTVYDMRRKFLDRTIFVLKEFDELKMYAMKNEWITIQKNDSEAYHTWELYALWNEKWEFVKAARDSNSFKSNYFIWCDIGSFRSEQFMKWLKHFASGSKVKERLRDHSKIALLLMSPFGNVTLEKNGLPPVQLDKENHIGGTIAGGHKKAWTSWNDHYYDLQKMYIKAGRNAGKDQNVMNAVAMKYPDSVNLVTPEAYFNGKGDPWFYLQYYFS